MPPKSLHRRTPRPGLGRLAASLVTAGVVVAVSVLATQLSQGRSGAYPVADNTSYSIWPDSVVPKVPADPETSRVTLGVVFSANEAGSITALRFYKSAANLGPHTGQLWTRRGRLLASVAFPSTSTSGWQVAPLSNPVPLVAGRRYVASYTAPHGRYADDVNSLSPTNPTVNRSLTAWKGTYSYGTGVPTQTWRDSNYYVDVVFAPGQSATSAPTAGGTASGTATPTVQPSPSSTGSTSTTSTSPSPTSGTSSSTPTTTSPSPTSTTSTATPSTGGFPNATNTGVPAGTTLSPYSGPCTIRSSVTITAVDATNCSAIVVQAGAAVTISKSKLPRIESTDESNLGSVKVTDSTISSPTWGEGVLWGYNLTAIRDNITGGQHSVHCNNSCDIEDSYLHGQYNPTGGSTHNNAFITNGGTNMLVRHNTLWCDVTLNSTDGGCTADVSLFGDFDPVSHVTIDNNLLKANNSSISYCAYGGHEPSKSYPNSTYIVFTNNVFERGANNKCGVYGPVTSFDASATGNQWSGNVWSDGTPLSAN